MKKIFETKKFKSVKRRVSLRFTDFVFSLSKILKEKNEGGKIEQYKITTPKNLEFKSEVIYKPSGVYDWLGKYATSFPETEEEEENGNKKKVIKN